MKYRIAYCLNCGATYAFGSGSRSSFEEPDNLFWTTVRCCDEKGDRMWAYTRQAHEVWVTLRDDFDAVDTYTDRMDFVLAKR